MGELFLRHGVDTPMHTMAINVKMNGSVLEEKLSVMLGLSFFAKLDLGSYIVFLLLKWSNGLKFDRVSHKKNFLLCLLWVLMMMMNCFCGMVDQRKVFSLISSWNHCQRSSPLRISDTPQAEFEPAQNLSLDLVE